MAGTIQYWNFNVRINAGYSIIVKGIPSSNSTLTAGAWTNQAYGSQPGNMPNYCYLYSNYNNWLDLGFVKLNNNGYLDISVDTIHQLVSIIKGGAG